MVKPATSATVNHQAFAGRRVNEEGTTNPARWLWKEPLNDEVFLEY